MRSLGCTKLTQISTRFRSLRTSRIPSSHWAFELWTYFWRPCDTQTLTKLGAYIKTSSSDIHDIRFPHCSHHFRRNIHQLSLTPSNRTSALLNCRAFFMRFNSNFFETLPTEFIGSFSNSVGYIPPANVTLRCKGIVDTYERWCHRSAQILWSCSGLETGHQSQLCGAPPLTAAELPSAPAALMKVWTPVKTHQRRNKERRGWL